MKKVLLWGLIGVGAYFAYKWATRQQPTSPDKIVDNTMQYPQVNVGY